jgi:type II secretion system protein I
MHKAGTFRISQQKRVKASAPADIAPVHPPAGRLSAFTFVEVLVALAIVSISLLALLKLHVISIRLADAAEITSQAALLADEKIAEVLAPGYPQLGSNAGIVERNNRRFEWQTEVTDLRLPQLDEVSIGGLRKIAVDVGWKNGSGKKHLEMSTYVADRKLK